MLPLSSKFAGCKRWHLGIVRDLLQNVLHNVQVQTARQPAIEL